jgi:hypothetical protein
MEKIKSQALSNSMRDKILDQIIKDAFNKEKTDHEESRYKFSEKVYENIYKSDIRKKMNELPDGWLPETTEFSVQFGSEASGYCRRMLKDPKRFPNSAVHGGGYSRPCLKVFDNADPLTTEHKKITDRGIELDARMKKAASEARAILYSCNTTSQLKTVWPAAKKYAEMYEPTSKAKTHIALQTKELNQLLGLK